MSLYRSEPMSLCQLILTEDVAFNCMAELGELGLIQFKDLNKKDTLFKRKYYNEVKRCETMEKQIKYLLGEIKKRDIQTPPIELLKKEPPVTTRMLTDYETRLESLEKEVSSIESSISVLSKNYMGLTELKHLLRKTQAFFDEVDRRNDSTDPRENSVFYRPSEVGLTQLEDSNITFLSRDALSLEMGRYEPGTSKFSVYKKKPTETEDMYPNTFKLNFVAGVLSKEKVIYFERMLFRVCHANTLLKYVDIEFSIPSEYLETGQNGDLNKTVFLVFFQGEQLRSKVLKICESFHATIYPCPETKDSRRKMAMGVMTRLEDLNIVLKQTLDHHYQVLNSLVPEIQLWMIRIHKTKAIYHQLNKLRYDRNLKTLFGRCWCPTKELENIQATLHRGTEISGMSPSSAIIHSIVSSSVPPTYHANNKVTDVYQSVINSYGVPWYMEINPAPFSIITFPFLFSLMFGDLGHGFILTLLGLCLILYEKKFSPEIMSNEIFQMVFTARYLITMMGAFSMYSGLLYNDCFAKPLNMFWGSSWSSKNMTEHELENALPLDPVRGDMFKGSPYLLGMDPIWQMATNKISWLNSYKMKISVIFGVIHMFFGVMLSLMNHIHFKRYLNIICLFIPQVIYLLFTFGYLILLIFHKWCMYDASVSNVAPSLLIDFINMFLFVYPSDPPHAVVGNAKKILQINLILVAVICIPWMLLVKPYILLRRHKMKKQRDASQSIRVSWDPSLSNDSNDNNINDDDVYEDRDDVRLLGSRFDDDLEKNLRGRRRRRVGLLFNHRDDDDDDRRGGADDDDDVYYNEGHDDNDGESSDGDDDDSDFIDIERRRDVDMQVNQSSSMPLSESVRSKSSDISAEKLLKNSVRKKKEFSFGEVFINSCIHTIEYCLGCVSHTASYLRLWALSLAHAQLSEVLWHMVLSKGFTMGGSYGFIFAYIFFAPWAVLTVVILLAMEGLSAFLHTLRLHWIEFMSKFFWGNGKEFDPFMFRLNNLREFYDF